MNRSQALAIMGIQPDIGTDDLKKRYHALIMLTHPDSVKEHDYPYHVYEINAAYEYLLKNMEEEIRRKETRERSIIRWNAPQNPNAYAPRDIYQYYDDLDGNRIGIVTVDTGRYMWIGNKK